MNQKIKSYFLILIIIIPMSVFGQQIDARNPNFQIGFVPHYILKSGARIDFEYIFKDSKQQIFIAPKFYSEELNSNEYFKINYTGNIRYDRMKGLGAAAGHTIFLYTNKWDNYGIYIGYGTEYDHFSINYRLYDWVKFTDYDLEYYTYELISVLEKINRFKIHIHFGIQYNFAEVLFISGHLGYGGVYSFSNTDHEITENNFNKNMNDFSYTGTYVPINFKFGVRF